MTLFFKRITCGYKINSWKIKSPKRRFLCLCRRFSLWIPFKTCTSLSRTVMTAGEPQTSWHVLISLAACSCVTHEAAHQAQAHACRHSQPPRPLSCSLLVRSEVFSAAVAVVCDHTLPGQQKKKAEPCCFASVSTAVLVFRRISLEKWPRVGSGIKRKSPLKIV